MIRSHRQVHRRSGACSRRWIWQLATHAPQGGLCGRAVAGALPSASSGCPRCLERVRLGHRQECPPPTDRVAKSMPTLGARPRAGCKGGSRTAPTPLARLCAPAFLRRAQKACLGPRLLNFHLCGVGACSADRRVCGPRLFCDPERHGSGVQSRMRDMLCPRRGKSRFSARLRALGFFPLSGERVARAAHSHQRARVG
jgi:hypothetical protein